MGIDVSCLGPAAQRRIFQKLLKQQPKTSKFGNVKIQRGANTFDSKKEANRYDELMLMQQAGEIRGLRLLPQFTLQESYKTHDGKRVQAIRYVAGFSYMQHELFVVEDVKNTATKTATYQIKRNLMQERLGIEIVEV